MTNSAMMIQEYVKEYQLPQEGVEHEWLPFQDTFLSVQLFCQQQKETNTTTILFIHGLFDHTGTNAPFIKHLLDKGYQVAAFDLPGHGLSGGERFQISSFQEYQSALQTVMGKLKDWGVSNMHAVGHSTGGAVLAEYVLTNTSSSPFQKVGLISPLIRSNQWWISKSFTPIISLFRKQLPRKFRMNAGNKEFMQKIKNDPLQGKIISLEWVQAMFEWEKQLTQHHPVDKDILIIQGTNDQTVDWKHNMKAYAALFPNSKRLLVDEGNHHLINEKMEKRSLVYQLLTEYFRK
ncbi:Lysophospholipase, alpha-beta hydrolase superfamily [Alteribacillus persepolensis]|uniref:Lysophospholipase, alpha-beta hydrolase superfamily n=1 Tax=Alteribacillus persepolensis TaxID=568899 RepID=A0A1G8CB22_9BACI|nr:alpha/beta hydrolase [Alteribacillus persepolensis]SDH42433.1 Lysophospholipase, alpha-beta hydrolase superfamily [Alteribacillus persepolensis]